jgi:hypothetical protein
MATWHCYCDESCTSKPHRYMAMGAVLVRHDQCEPICESIRAWRSAHNMAAELKWQKISQQKLLSYLTYLHARLGEIKAGAFNFAALILDNHKLDHKAFNDGSAIIGQGKFLYQLILHRLIPLMGDGDRVCIFPDAMRDSGDYGELQGALNNGIALKYGRRRNMACKVQPICSKTSEFVQLNDLLLGAVGFHANSKQHVPSSRSAKRNFAAYMAHSLDTADLGLDTPPGQHDFQVWRFLLSDSAKKRHHAS